MPSDGWRRNPFVNQVFSVDKDGYLCEQSYDDTSQSLRKSGLFRRGAMVRIMIEEWLSQSLRKSGLFRL